MKRKGLQIRHLQIAHSQQHARGECCNTNTRALFKVGGKKEKRSQLPHSKNTRNSFWMYCSTPLKSAQKRIKRKLRGP
jgi:hypothetical protein